MKRSLSGIKPTGEAPHIGNYLGMIQPAIALQSDYDAFYFVADYHALTTERDADLMRRSTYTTTATFLAFGLDPDRAAFFRQSDIPEVTELTWLLSCVATMGQLERAHAYKAAKDRGEAGVISHGVFCYPVLMAADILIYDSNVVPVGKDQVQHIEITRDIAQRFNHLFGEIFVLPEPLVDEAVMTIPGLDGRKMSKSYGNDISVVLPPKQLRKRIMQIVTDSTPLEDPKDPDTCNVFALYTHFASKEQQAELAEKYRGGNYGYGHAKQALYEVVNGHIAPYRERFDALRADEDYLEDVLRAGAAKVRGKAQEVLDRARHGVGFPRRFAQ